MKWLFAVFRVFVLAALAVMGWWAPFGWWRPLAVGGAVQSFLLISSHS